MSAVSFAVINTYASRRVNCDDRRLRADDPMADLCVLFKVHR